MQVAVLSYYPGWGVGAGVTMNDTVKKLKARNPNIKVFLYERPETETHPDGSDVHGCLHGRSTTLSGG